MTTMGQSGEGPRSETTRRSGDGGTPADPVDVSIPPLPYPYRRAEGADPYVVPTWLHTVPEVERRWVPMVDIHLPMPVLVIADIIDRLTADDIERVLTATSYPDSEDVLRIGYWQAIEP